MNISRVFPVFTIVYSIIYGLAEPYEFILFRYYPAKKIFSWTAQPAAAVGPPINWYGWMAWAAIGGVIVSVIALFLPQRWIDRLWPALSWAVPTVAGLYLVWLARFWFI